MPPKGWKKSDAHDRAVPESLTAAVSDSGADVAVKRRPRISILERRLQNPFGEPSQKIKMKQAGLEPHWFNEQTRPGQIHRAKELGWEHVTMDMIADPDSLGMHSLNAANHVVRGDRGQEYLMWMPSREYQQIQVAKARKNLDDMRDHSKQSRDMLNAVAQKYGSHAADYMSDKVKVVGGVTDSPERIEVTPEPDGPV